MNSNSLAYHANIHSYQLVLEYIPPDMYNPKYSYMHIQLVTGFTLDFSIYLANTGITHWRVVKSTFISMSQFPTFYLYKLFTIVSKSFTLLHEVRILYSMVHASLATLLFLSEPKSQWLELWNNFKSQLILRYIIYYCQGCKSGIQATSCNYALLPCWEVIRWFILSSVYQVFIVEY
jgi:hypothetical protein